MIKPGQLRNGDVIGLFSPSSEIASFPRRTKRAIEALKGMGFQVKLAGHALGKRGQSSGSPEQRAADFHELAVDPEVRAILCTTGGLTANGILPLIDPELIASNRKILCGYSDVTAVLSAVTAKTGLVTFYGPTLLPSFGEAGGPFEFTQRWFRAILMESGGPVELDAPAEFTDEFLLWDREDNRPRKTAPAPPWKRICPGTGEGQLIAGNLSTLTKMLGTPFAPPFDEAVLFLEETGGTPGRIESSLDHLVQAGAFRSVRGLVFGRPSQFSDEGGWSLNDVLRAIGRKHGIPVLANVDFGHTEPRLTLPIGIPVRVDADQLSIRVLEKAVEVLS